jgi:hypothetical protein
LYATVYFQGEGGGNLSFMKNNYLSIVKLSHINSKALFKISFQNEKDEAFQNALFSVQLLVPSPALPWLLRWRLLQLKNLRAQMRNPLTLPASLLCPCLKCPQN